jgi:hypothetical protein
MTDISAAIPAQGAERDLVGRLLDDVVILEENGYLLIAKSLEEAAAMLHADAELIGKLVEAIKDMKDKCEQDGIADDVLSCWPYSHMYYALAAAKEAGFDGAAK